MRSEIEADEGKGDQRAQGVRRLYTPICEPSTTKVSSSFAATWEIGASGQELGNGFETPFRCKLVSYKCRVCGLTGEVIKVDRP